MFIQVGVKKRVASPGRVFPLEVNFACESSRLVLFGPSGSGKTLTLQLLTGLLTPDSGRIVIGDRVLFDAEQHISVPARHRAIGYVPQDYALFSHLSVADNIGFGLPRRWPWGLNRSDRRRVAEFLEIFELSDLGAGLPRDLSGGQRQRVALARALICRPQLLLLDEPFAALDGFLRANMRRLLLEVQASFHLPIILITHDPEDVAALAQTLVVYEMGRGSRVVSQEDFSRELASMPALQMAKGAGLKYEAGLKPARNCPPPAPPSQPFRNPAKVGGLRFNFGRICKHTPKGLGEGARWRG
jgi:molybdate transport system ATP-binding protein